MMRFPAHWSSRTGSSQIIECQFCQFCFTVCFPVRNLIRSGCLYSKTLGAFVPKSCENVRTPPPNTLYSPVPFDRETVKDAHSGGALDQQDQMFDGGCLASFGFTAWTRIFVHLGDRVSFTDLCLMLPLRLWVRVFLSHVRTDLKSPA